MATINITGTGGIIEGNLGTSDVNVNLDPVYGNFNGTTSSSLSTDNDFDDIFDTNGGCASAWVYPKSLGENDQGHLFNTESSSNGWKVYVGSESGGICRIYFSVQFSTTDGIWYTDRVLPFNAWSHIAVTYDADATANNPVLYLNGVALTLTESSTPAGTRNSDASNTFYIGNTGGENRTWDGYIMDVKAYKNVAVTATNVAKMASKINVDKSAPDMPSAIRLWWKGTASTGTDSSGEGNNLTASNMGSVVYDAFSVDVYDNSTTTDGTFTVTQGKVEGKALTSGLFDGTNDFINPGNALQSQLRTSHTLSAWVKFDDGDPAANNTIFGAFNGGNDRILFYNGTDAKLTYLYQANGTSKYAQAASASFVNDANPWHHCVATMSYTDSSNAVMKLYLDGVELALDGTNNGAFSGDMGGYTSSTAVHLGAENNNGSNDAELDGNARDFRFYDYALSADQVASYYSNTFPVTPLHRWKLDEGSDNLYLDGFPDGDSGTGADNFDSGTAGSAHGYNQNGATYTNGTLDLDGTLTIAANGTLSAPRGNLDLAANIDNAGTFTHNDGTVRGLATVYINNSSSVAFTFYNWQQTTGQLRFYKDETIERQLQLDSGTSHCYIWANRTLTMGTATNPESSYPKLINSMNTTDKQFFFYQGDGQTGTLQGVLETHPIIFTNTNSSDIEWGYHANSTAQIKNIDFQFDVTTDGDTDNIKLTGDCEFDAVTVSSGATLDLNGQRAEFSGTLNIDGTLDADGLIVSSGSIDEDGGFSNADSCDMILTGAVSHDFRGATHRNILINTGTGTSTNNATKDLGTTPFTIGSGTFSNGSSGRNLTCGNFTIATGGTYTADDATVTVAGDFTASGGLLGASAITLDGGSPASKYVSCNDTVVNGATTYTMEAWIKPDVNNVTQHIIDARDSGSDGTALSLINQTVRFRINSDDLITDNVITTTGRWYHIAATRDSSNVTKIYVDGKLVKQGSSTASISISQNLRIGALAYAPPNEGFDGSIDEVRIWNDERSPTEIRANMFSEISSVGSDLILYAKFNEGTGNPVDSGTNTRTLTATGDVWAGSGTFTYGTSTLNMTGSNSKIKMGAGSNDFYNIGLAPSGGTTTFEKVSETNAMIYGLLTHNGGTMASSGNVYFTIKPTGMITAGATIPYIVYWQNTNDNVPSANFQYFISNTSTITFGGNCTFTGYLRNLSGNTMVMGAYTHSVASWVSSGTNTFNLTNSTINATSGGTWTEFRPKDSSTGTTTTLVTGNTSINGHSNGTHWLSAPAMNCEIVGDVSNLIFKDAGEYTGYDNYANDITVIGSITNCTGVGFRQWHHTLDTQQLLDADEAGDDDLRLTKPALDNALELMTK